MTPGFYFQTCDTEYSCMLIKNDPKEQDAMQDILEDLDNLFSKEIERKVFKYCHRSDWQTFLESNFITE